MSQSAPSAQRTVTELKVTAHMMQLDRGVFCIFHTPGGPTPDPVTGLPGVRVSRPPLLSSDALEISTFNPEGWVGGDGSAALIRVLADQAQVLVTIYQATNSQVDAPQLQVMRLADVQATAARPVAQAPGTAVAGGAAVSGARAAAAPSGPVEIAAHIQRRGDVGSQIGEWMGEPGSQSWIEGFAISPASGIEAADIEYQAVLGKGWLSPWSEGGQYCGSRGMALPILGLRVRLKGQAAERFECELNATFTDGTRVGPLDGTETAEAPSLAPLEAFRIDIRPAGAIPQAPSPDHEEEGELETVAADGPQAARGRSPSRPQPRTPLAKPVHKGRR
ncbi:hypothetical protein [Rhizosaccharibacter radicis]|uniref:Clostridial hydrophobic W n=1 Tax=Rhizosaccharibacter radicis TaxID=2782605 RepID=A0ABT1VVD9_9PROT|nr:hypothetical protein [Acetobacteraceae bacterium KSS12]